METNNVQEVETKVKVAGELVYGIEGFKKPTPMWVKWIFRCVLLIWFMFKTMIVNKLDWPDGKKSDYKDYADWIMFATWVLGKPAGIRKEEIAKDLGLDI